MNWRKHVVTHSEDGGDSGGVPLGLPRPVELCWVVVNYSTLLKILISLKVQSSSVLSFLPSISA